MNLRPAALLLLPFLAACSDPEATGRFLVAAPAPERALPNRLGRAELREVTLPAYASGQEIGWQTPDGAVRTNPQNVWADDPQAAATRLIARQISQASGATVIPDPWPLAGSPDRRIEVRVDEMLARADGRFVLSGSYYVSPVAGPGGDTVRLFAIAVPIAAQGPAGIAAAQSAALQRLAFQIAQLQ